MDKTKQNFSILSLTRQEIPDITEDVKTRYDWIPVGILDRDDYFPILTDAYNSSTTTAAAIEGITDLIYGKGILTKDKTLQEEFEQILDEEDLRRLVFDYKLYGNASLQVVWNNEHTRVVKLYHTPVQNYRAEKIYDQAKVKNYYYCTDWSDQQAQRDKKKVPLFGTSEEKVEVFYIKDYSPGKYYYSLPDWISSLQLAFVEAELSNLHINNIENGFLPLVMVNFNNGVPSPEERYSIESMVESKFTGTRNAGRFLISFNDDPENKPTIDTIQTENLHDKYQYVADYAQDRILVAHRVTSPLLFGIRTATNGFSSQSEEMMTAYSILQTMTIQPYQSKILSTLNKIFKKTENTDYELYFDQLTPLSILSQTADDTGDTVEKVQDDINDSMESGQDDEETTEPIIKENNNE